MNRERLVGPARLVLTGLVGAGLLALATNSPAAPVVSAGSAPGAGSELATVTSASLSCPGPELSGISGVDDIEVPAQVAAATAPSSIVSGPSVKGKGSLVLQSGSTAGAPASERGATTSQAAQPGHGTDVRATGSMAPGLAAAQEWSVARDEIRGLATVPCAGPGSDLWLLAGGGDAGRQERLVLTNPGSNEVTVDLSAYGTKGLLPSPTGATVVPAKGRVAVLVDAITGAEKSPAVRVRANGGSVRAVMSDMWLDGSTPAGAETTVPTAEPATRQVIPGVFFGTSGSLRVVVPGDKQAVVSARLIGKDGVSPLGGGVLRVPARSTGELPITGLPRGVHAVELSADVPIAAAAWSTDRAGTAAGDFVWAPSTPATQGLLGAAFPVVQGEDRQRVVSVVASGGPAKVSVTWRDAATNAWKAQDVSLNQDSAGTVAIGAATSVWVMRTSGTGDVRASTWTSSGADGAKLVSVAPLTDSEVMSTVSRARPVN